MKKGYFQDLLSSNEDILICRKYTLEVVGIKSGHAQTESIKYCKFEAKVKYGR